MAKNVSPEQMLVQLRARVIQLYRVAPEQKLRDLLHNTHFGTRKPTALLNDMKLQAGGNYDANIVRLLFLDRLMVHYNATKQHRYILLSYSDLRKKRIIKQDNITVQLNTDSISPFQSSKSI